MKDGPVQVEKHWAHSSANASAIALTAFSTL